MSHCCSLHSSHCTTVRYVIEEAGHLGVLNVDKGSLSHAISPVLGAGYEDERFVSDVREIVVATVRFDLSPRCRLYLKLELRGRLRTFALFGLLDLRLLDQRGR